MAYGTHPQGRYLLIGHHLQRLRESRGLTLTSAARQSHHSPSWLSTVENGLASVRTDDLIALLGLYACAESDLAASLIYLAEQGRQRGWWREFEGRVSPAPLDYASLEAHASS